MIKAYYNLNEGQWEACEDDMALSPEMLCVESQEVLNELNELPMDEDGISRRKEIWQASWNLQKEDLAVKVGFPKVGLLDAYYGIVKEDSVATLESVVELAEEMLTEGYVASTGVEPFTSIYSRSKVEELLEVESNYKMGAQHVYVTPEKVREIVQYWFDKGCSAAEAEVEVLDEPSYEHPEEDPYKKSARKTLSL